MTPGAVTAGFSLNHPSRAPVPLQQIRRAARRLAGLQTVPRHICRDRAVSSTRVEMSVARMRISGPTGTKFLRQRLHQTHGDRIGLLARGTRRAPDAQRRKRREIPRWRFSRQQIRSAPARAENRCDWWSANRSAPPALRRWSASHVLEIILEVRETLLAHLLAQPRRHQALLAVPSGSAQTRRGEHRLIFRNPPAVSDRRRSRLGVHFIAAALPNRPSGSRIRPTRPSPRIAPPATPGTLRSVSPRLLITTSCLPISSSTTRQNRWPSASVTISRLSQRFSDFGRHAEIAGAAGSPAAASRAPGPSRRGSPRSKWHSSAGLSISRTAKIGTM